jgi:hypothetical protein
MEQEEFYLRIHYKNKTIRYRLNDPNATLNVLMQNLRHSVDAEGKAIFDLPNVDNDLIPVEYYFGKKDENDNNIILNPKIGKTECCLRDYNVKSGDTLEVIMDPIAG